MIKVSFKHFVQTARSRRPNACLISWTDGQVYATIWAPIHIVSHISRPIHIVRQIVQLGIANGCQHHPQNRTTRLAHGTAIGEHPSLESPH